MTMGSKGFRVIVVGGGPVGLCCAHALLRAGIDFVLLERRSSLVVDAGANLVLVPWSMRALGQLGLLEELKNVSSQLKEINRLDHSGQPLADMKWFVYDDEHFGAPPRAISRHDLTKVLYESLPADTKSKLLPNKKVSHISTETSGVSVTCEDGTSYEGSVVIGADGAHSFVRECMRQLATKSGSSPSSVNEEKPYLTTYRCLWVRFPSTPDIPPGTSRETHGYTTATQLFAGVDTAVVSIYERLEEPTRERSRYSEADESALIERWGHLPLVNGNDKSTKTTVRDAYKLRLQSGMTSLEEGVVEHWSWDGRIVLAGDAAHKFTPSTGAGFNNGVIDVVALVNELQKALQVAQTESIGAEAPPDQRLVAAALQTYEDSRKEVVVDGCMMAGNATAMATWQSWLLRFLDQYIFSFHIVQKFLSTKQAAKAAHTPIFNFTGAEEQMVGKMPWVNPLGTRPMGGKAEIAGVNR